MLKHSATEMPERARVAEAPLPQPKPSHDCNERGLDAKTKALYRHALDLLRQIHCPFLVGGAYALAGYTGITRHTKDFDLFVLPHDAQAALDQLAAGGFQTEMTFPHWLGKAYAGDEFIDVIFSSGNGIARVDDCWFEHATEMEVLGTLVAACPPEEIIWSKCFIQERERFDGADIAHLLHATAATLDWGRLVARFGPHWRALLAHLVLFGFIYPERRNSIPEWVMVELTDRLNREMKTSAPADTTCRGTLLSREQYLIDIQRWGYRDARLQPDGALSAADIARWTAGIGT